MSVPVLCSMRPPVVAHPHRSRTAARTRDTFFATIFPPSSRFIFRFLLSQGHLTREIERKRLPVAGSIPSLPRAKSSIHESEFLLYHFHGMWRRKRSGPTV